ncbi:MAG: LuxR C-terminal-related transcriptional regulator [Brevefilum fermentans]|jgi:LuxR family maltose regulon positive regulatory protein|nr:LuxR C-terminal-related transcriptional regulator [Brevefilum fermentans]MDI9566036.1 LuxR C-terminal-related transcriptional regulator [Chloroflexota bacterium]
MTEQQITSLFVTEMHAEQAIVDPVCHAKMLLLSGNYQSCLDFIQQQASDLLETSPQLIIYHAAALLFCEEGPGNINAVLNRAEKLDHTQSHTGEIAALRAIISSYFKDPEEGIKQSKLALKLIKPGNTYFQHIVERNLGMAYTIKNDLGNATIWFEKLLMSGYQLEDWGSVLAAYNYLTYIRKVQGRLSEAETIYQKSLRFINDHDVKQNPHTIKLLSGYGHLMLFWHRLDEAKSYLQKAIQLAGHSEILYAFTAHQNLCETYIREGNLSTAHMLLDDLFQLIQTKSDFYAKVHLQQANRLKSRLLIEEGHHEQAFDWLVTSGFDGVPPDELYERYGYELGLTLPIAARIYILNGLPEHAIQILRAVIPKFMHQSANSYIIRSLTALAVAYEQIGKDDLAVCAFSKAVALAKLDNNQGDFLLMGQSLLPLINLYENKNGHQGFLTNIRNILHTNLQNQAKSVIKSCSDNLLSQRESDVLQLIAKGLTNKQIGEVLFLSSNTIKSHRSNIYRKLRAENRIQAISQAKNMGVLTGAP